MLSLKNEGHICVYPVTVYNMELSLTFAKMWLHLTGEVLSKPATNMNNWNEMENEDHALANITYSDNNLSLQSLDPERKLCTNPNSVLKKLIFAPLLPTLSLFFA